MNRRRFLTTVCCLPALPVVSVFKLTPTTHLEVTRDAARCMSVIFDDEAARRALARVTANISGVNSMMARDEAYWGARLEAKKFEAAIAVFFDHEHRISVDDAEKAAQ